MIHTAIIFNDEISTILSNAWYNGNNIQQQLRFISGIIHFNEFTRAKKKYIGTTSFYLIVPFLVFQMFNYKNKYKNVNGIGMCIV